MEFDPLDYHVIADTVVSALLQKPVESLPIANPFPGAGVYLVYYTGTFEPYRHIRGKDVPIYVGKAIPPSSGGSGVLRQIEPTTDPSLFNRLRDHTQSIAAAENLELSDFGCRYLVVTPIWISIAESLLIEKFHPVWNVAVKGFGLHHPGKPRFSQRRSDWDTLHPGRMWEPMMQPGKAVAKILAAIDKHFTVR